MKASCFKRGKMRLLKSWLFFKFCIWLVDRAGASFLDQSHRKVNKNQRNPGLSSTLNWNCSKPSDLSNQMLNWSRNEKWVRMRALECALVFTWPLIGQDIRTEILSKNQLIESRDSLWCHYLKTASTLLGNPFQNELISRGYPSWTFRWPLSYRKKRFPLKKYTYPSLHRNAASTSAGTPSQAAKPRGYPISTWLNCSL